MLEYENQILLDVIHQDGLLITAKGLGFETVFKNLLKVYSDPGNLVIVLGTTPKEEDFYIKHLEEENVKCLPKVITTEYHSADRENVYLEGGVLFVSPSILVVDLLKDRVPVTHVTGFLVCRAHSILDSCQEAFAVRLYRQKNKTGFIKAFSCSPQSFTVGFSQVQRVMKTLFIRNLYLWPRFHANVQSSLDKMKPSVVEMHVPLTESMLQIQNSLLDLMSYCVKELKRINPTLDTEELTVENAISKSFHKILQLQLDPIWHQLSSKTKQLVADLKTLRHVLSHLIRYDCVTFNKLINTLRGTEYALKSSGWRFLDSSETLFLVSKQRMMGMCDSSGDGRNIDPEPNPKWLALSEILTEITETCKKEDCTSPNRVLILVQDTRICDQLKQYLTVGGKNMLLYLYEKTFDRKVPHLAQPLKSKLESPSGSKETVEKGEVVEISPQEEIKEDCDFKESYVLSQRPKPEVEDDADKESDSKIAAAFFEECQEMDLHNVTMANFEAPVVVIQTFKKYGDPLALPKTLKELQPGFVVLYDADVGSVRRLEVYQNEHPELQLHIFFVMYKDSVEEQEYLTTLRREKEAFEYLIKEKATMVIPEGQEGLTDDCEELSRDPSKANQTVNTRKGGFTDQQNKRSTVIVDIREFRSDLPSLIHKRGMEVEPIMLQVGDYILTPDICVERKSVSDLIGSLQSGRLYNQAVAMTRHYVRPMLLIEFDQNKPFVLQGQYYVSNDMSSSDVVAKLQLLTLHFPKLRIVWSPSPHATAQLFEELKQRREEPDPAKAASVGVEEEEELEGDEKYNSAIHDLVSKLPGVTTKNIRVIMRKGKSLDHLLQLSVEQLTEMLQNSKQAQSLYSALHEVYKPPQDFGDASKTSKNWRGRGRRFGGRKT